MPARPLIAVPAYPVRKGRVEGWVYPAAAVPTAYLEAVVRAGATLLAVPLYADTAAGHDFIAGQPGHFQRTLAALQAIRQAGAQAVVLAPLLRPSYRQLPMLVQKCVPAGVAALPQAAQIMAKALGDCFAATTAQRVQGTDTSTPASQGGPEVTAASAACQIITADSGNAAGVNFLHNGYSAAQLFYPLLTSDTMTGAQFSVPEIMAIRAAASPGFMRLRLSESL